MYFLFINHHGLHSVEFNVTNRFAIHNYEGTLKKKKIIIACLLSCALPIVNNYIVTIYEQKTRVGPFLVATVHISPYKSKKTGT